MTISYADRIFWMRAGFGVLTGAVSQALFNSDYLSGILFAIVVYVGTFYLARTLWGGKMKPEDQRKVYTAGLGSYILLFLFFWILLFTLGLHYLNL